MQIKVFFVINLHFSESVIGRKYAPGTEKYMKTIRSTMSFSLVKKSQRKNQGAEPYE